MLFLTSRYNDCTESMCVHQIWEIKGFKDKETVETLYKDWIQKKAEKLNIVINPHWLNIMNYVNHNYHLSEKEYKQKEKEWKKILRQSSIDRFIYEELKGVKKNYVKLL